MTATAAFDWGGTWLRGGVVDERGEILAQARERCPADPSDQLELARRLIGRLEVMAATGIEAVGIGIAGIVREGQVISGSNLGLRNLDIQGELTRQLSLPVRVVNDTQAVALAELSMAGANETAVFLSVGTGIGGAVVYDGRLFPGRGAAGDFGHMPVIVDGPRCVCGATGCLEQLASGRVLNEVATNLSRSGRSPFLQRRASSGDPLHAGDLEDAAASGDEAATAVLDGAAMALVVGLRCVAAAYDPDRVVLGGGLLQAGSYLLNKLQAGWAEKRSAWTSPEVTLARHGEDAGLLGAALLWAPRGDEPADVVAGGEPDR